MDESNVRLLFLLLQRLFYAVAFLSAWVPFFATPERGDDRVFILQVSSGAENLVWEVVGVVAGAVSAEFVFRRFLLHAGFTP